MRASTAYFAGAGTVVGAVVVGLGGGLMMANIVSPHTPKHGTEMSKLERRMPAEPIPVTNAPSQPVPYVAATQAAPTVAAAGAPASQAQQGQQTQATAPAPAAQSAPREQAALSEETKSSEIKSSDAKSSDAKAPDKARDYDVKRAVVERRRAERRQQWAERHHKWWQDRDLRDVEQKVRGEAEPTQALTAEPTKVEMPRIRLFDSDD